MRRPSPLTVVEALALLAFLVLAGLVLARPPEGGELAPLDPAALAAGPARERWYGIFFQDQHVGYAVTRSAGAEGGGRVFQNRSAFRLAAFGRIQDVVTAGTALTDADGRLSRFDFFMSAEGVKLSARGEVRDGEVVLEVDQAGRTSRLAFPVDRPPAVGLTLEQALAGEPLAVGHRFAVPYFDPVTMAEGEMQVEVTGVEVLENGEEAWWLRTDFSGVQARMLVTSAGETIRQEGALGLSMVRMTEQDARAVDADEEPVDIIALSAAPVQGRIPDPRGTRLLVLRVRGVDPARVVEQPPLQRREGDRVRIEVPLAAELPRLPFPAAPGEADPATLQPTLTLPSTHPDIVAKAREIAGDAPDRAEAARRLVDWVYRHVEKVPTFGVPDGLEVLRTLRGDCNEHTALTVSLARALGIPARIAAGVVYSDRMGPKGAFYYHAWPELRLGGDWEWVPVDPTFGQFPADATHVKLVEGDLDRQVEIMSVMGRLGFEVEEAR